MNNKEAKALLNESCSVGKLIGTIIGYVFACIFIAAVIYVVTFVLALIPILGWILAAPIGILGTIFNIFNFVSSLLTLIGYARSKATLTEVGIFGNKNPFGTFDITFDQIQNIKYSRGRITITYGIGVGKPQKLNIYGISNAKNFANACKEQMAKAKAAPAEAKVEA
ncbi:MAG: hypothetical protein IKB28_11815 [Clostridia bacterium]|nr:hypothetical protein [Clostridia bacterium]MBR2447333.1 hypothetical protein [Clostridia bacterium]